MKKSQYQTDTILSEMMIDIYVSPDQKDVWILHDKQFKTELLRLNYVIDSASLLFVFADKGERDLGSIINENLRPHFEKAHEVTLILMDEGEVADILQVPLKKTP